MDHTGNIQPQLDLEEHNHLARAKRTTVMGSDGVNYNELKIDSNGAISTTGGAAGVQYTEGDVDASITGTAAMWEDTGNTIRPISAVFPLPVNIVAGSSAGVTFDDGDAIDTTSQGTLILGSDAMPGTARVIRTAADGSVRIDPTGVTAQPVSGTVAATQGTSPWVVSGTVTAAPRTSTAGTPAGFTVSNSATLVAASNANRRALVAVNFGSSNIYLGHTNAVTTSGAATGLKLVPNGSYQDSGDGLYTGDLYAIGDAVSASQNLSVSERT